MKPSDLLLLNNKSWAEERRALDPGFFARLAQQQKPRFLWIGCSDSRVPANTITGMDPGEIFVHRNIANMCATDDLNLLSVLEYAVSVLEVEHVIVCGHYGCGGVQAALTAAPLGAISHWLRPLRALAAEHGAELDALPPDRRSARLCEWNVRAQAQNLARSAIVQTARQIRGAPWVHAWIYGLHDGILQELDALSPFDASRGAHADAP